MSATNPSSSDREGEALRRAQRAYEPSMEEILASIRSMIGDEREMEKAAPPKSASGRPPAAAPQIVFSKDDPLPSRAPQEALNRAEPPPAPEVKTPAGERPAIEARLSTQTRPAPEMREPMPRGPQSGTASPKPVDFALPEDELLLSQEAGETVTTAFEALSANLAAHGAEIAREMARDMLRPMLKAWLDENLPGIVERLVRAEIERVARGIR